MGVLLAWVVGYVAGAQAGVKGFDDVVRAVKEVRDSDEVRGLVAVLRSHVALALRSTAELLERTSAPAPADQSADLLDRVRLLMKKS